MSETKWTPGPWKHGKTPHRYKDGSTQTFGADCVYSGDLAVCQVYGLWTNATLEEMEGESTQQVGLANAHLIAAAPDLYAALEEARVMMQAAHSRDICFVCIDAALAKARGESK